ncbi:GGDEF domain [Legionella beliardensis]|uniref:GGDEF domain n=1 Tax=Legionella beliardensis TaxID=91822 RepID=A0A378I030_9GAMM|nr:diguanylate cyclase [Legionella beliardensis]STX28070.1 GGDEF domain [Legionella beliardensis]
MNQQTVWVINNINAKKLFPLEIGEASSVIDLPTEAPYALILAKSPNQHWIELLRDIRKKKEYRFTPVFYHGDVPPRLRHIFDGPADSDTLEKCAKQIYDQLNTITKASLETEDKESILLTYLYSRSESCVQGYKTSASKYIYEYPLLNILFDQGSEIDNWPFLEDLTLRDLLYHKDLIDEIKTCPACNSGLLNLKNSCPNCHSIDIKPQRFIHCFACGNIAQVPEFLRQERLICTRCHTKLEELGVDYEKPLEDKICNTCNHFFAEPTVELVCLVCLRASGASEFTLRRLYDYRLTRRGEYVARGIEKNIYTNFSHYFKVIDYSVFLSILGWQTKLAERYSSIYFSVMILEITNDVRLIELQGEKNSERLMGHLFTNLRQVFRESDLAARMDGTMFFLLPLANQDGCMIIIDRIKQAIEQLISTEIGKGLSMSIGYMTSAEIINSSLEDELVMAELKTRMLESNLCIIGNT